MFVPSEFLIMFVSTAVPHLKSLKVSPDTYTLGYFDAESATKKKCLITLTLGVYLASF